jgi:hypothetical protein
MRRRCVAALIAGILGVLAVTSFLCVVWRSPPIRQAIVWIDLLSPSLLMDAAAFFVLGGAYTLLRKRAGWTDARGQGRNPRQEWEPIVTVPICGLLSASSAIIFTLPLIHLWVTVPSLYYSIGGLLPYSDAFDYYDGAMRLLVEGKLDEWNMRRPLNAMLLAVRLALAGHDLRWALLIQAVILGISCFLMARAIARDFGSAAGLILFASLYAVSREHVRIITSESLGLTLGALASTILWLGARERQRYVVAFGLVVMTVALNTRAGAFLTLPALVAWAGWAFRNAGQRFDWRFGTIAMGAVALGFALNAAWLKLYGGAFGIGNGNFAFTLYGFSTGQPGWTRLYADYPASSQLGSGAVNHFAYLHAVENIRAHPLDLLRGLWTGMRWWWLALWAYVRVILSLVPYPSYLNVVFQVLLAIGVGRWLWLFRRDPAEWLLLAAAAGFFLSGAVVFPDAGFRALVVSYPLFFLMAGLGAAAWRLPDAGATTPPRQPVSTRPAIILSLALILLGFIGPAIGHRLERSRLVEPEARPGGEDVLVVRVGPGTPHLDVLAPDSVEPTFAPRVRDDDFARSLAEFPGQLADADPSGRLHGPVTVMLGYNLQRDRPGIFWIVGPAAMRTDEWRTMRLIGEIRDAGWFSYFYVSRFDPAPSHP